MRTAVVVSLHSEGTIRIVPNRNTGHGGNYRTADALLAARFRAEVRHFVGMGHTKSEAAQLALRNSDAWDVVVQNPDGSFRFLEPDEAGPSTSPTVPADNGESGS